MWVNRMWVTFWWLDEFHMHVVIYVGYFCVFKFICYDLFECFESSGAAMITHMLQSIILSRVPFYQIFQ